MPESIISPQVKTREIDQSFIPDFPEQVTAMVLGVTKKGNFFTPQTVTAENLSSKIGSPDYKNLKEYTSLTAQNYLSGGAETVMVMPVTALSGETMGDGYTFVATIATTDYEFLQMFPTRFDGSTSPTVTVSGTLSSLTITVDGTDIITDVDFTDAQVVQDFYERYRDPASSVNDVFVKSIIDVNDVATDLGEDTADITSATVAVNSVATSTVDYQNPNSPWVLSQDGDKLFRFHALSGSDIANRSFRVRISDVDFASELGNQEAYGKFTVELYSYSSNNLIDDRDRLRFENEVLLESFRCSLDPQSDDYITRRIGDRMEYFDSASNSLQIEGLYANRSNFVRVEVSDGLESLPTSMVPWGFERYELPIDFFAGQVPTIYRDATLSLDGGIDFSHPYVDFLHVEELSSTVTSFTTAENFMMGDPSTTDAGLRKFTFGVFGGTQGLPDNKVKNVGKDITADNTFGFDFSTDSDSGYVAFERALNILADKENIQFNVLFLAGLNLIDHQNIITKAIEVVESRGDAILFVDAGNPTSSDADMKAKASEYDSSYVSAFTPWLLSASNDLIPPSSAFANALSVNDRNFKPWFSLIGIERGRITGVTDVTRRYNLKARDSMVSNNINPIAKYKGNILIFGTETLQQRDTLLSKYPIRRLLIEAKNRISDIADFYIGKQFTDQMLASLSEEVEDELAQIRDQNGLEGFSVEFDDSADMRSRGIVNGAIALRPTTAVKGIVFTFKVTDTGVEFDF